MKARIYLLGRCDNPDCPKQMQSKQVDVVINEEDLKLTPCKCGGSIHWESLKIKHRPTKKKVWSWIIASIVLAVFLFSLGWCYYELYRFYSSDEMSTAQKIIRGKTSAEILKDLPGSAKYKANLLHVSRGTVLRIQQGATMPSSILDNGIRGLGTDHELLKRCPLLFRMRHSQPYDLYSAILNPEYEVIHE